MAESVITFPSKELKRTAGVALDIGGSTLKVAYTSTKGDETSVHFRCFPLASMDEGLAFLKTKMADLSVHPELLNVTGVTCSTHESKVVKAADAKLNILSEFQMFNEAFRFMGSQFSLDDMTHSLPGHVTAYANAMEASFAQFKQQMDKDVTTAEDTEKAEIATGVQYPCVMYTCGSCGLAYHMTSDGQLEWLFPDPMGGKGMLGLASLMLGVQDFDELISLAERGAVQNVDTYGCHIRPEDPESRYAVPDDLICYAFGQTHGRSLGDFKKEDIAASLVDMVAKQMASSAHQWAVNVGVKQVYFVGSMMARSQLVRDIMAKTFIVRNLQAKEGKSVDSFYFVKNGGFLGVLGTLLKTLNDEYTE